MDQKSSTQTAFEEHRIPGDSLAKTRLLLVGVLIVTFSLATVIYTEAYFNAMRQLQATKPRIAAAGIKQLYQVLAGCNFLLGICLTGGLVTFAFRVLGSGQVPPPGMRVAFSTKVRTGKNARNIATISLMLAVVVFVGFLLSGLHLWAVGQEYEMIYSRPFRSA
jgi:hypothetical protein